MLWYRVAPPALSAVMFVIRAYWPDFLSWKVAAGVPILALVSWFWLIQLVLLLIIGFVYAPAQLSIAGRTFTFKFFVPAIFFFTLLVLLSLLADIIWNEPVRALFPNAPESHFLPSLYHILV